jgi:hypothetical protein
VVVTKDMALLRGVEVSSASVSIAVSNFGRRERIKVFL